jgi:hypothetical protein
MLAEMMPFPNEETTPPVTKMYFVSIKQILFYGLQSYNDFTKKQFSPGLFQLLKTARTIILLRIPTPYPADSLLFGLE